MVTGHHAQDVTYDWPNGTAMNIEIIDEDLLCTQLETSFTKATKPGALRKFAAVMSDHTADSIKKIFSNRKTIWMSGIGDFLIPMAAKLFRLIWIII